MPNASKPRPESVYEWLNDNITPYDQLAYGNPNPTQEIPLRAENISVSGDTNKEIVIGLIDLDEAVTHYFKDVIKPSVIQNGQSIQVPIFWSFSERWYAVQKEGQTRDKEGRTLFPIITVKRQEVARNRDLGNKLDGNKVHNYQTFYTQYNRKNAYDNFSVLTNRIPVKRYQIEPVPDYVIVTYVCSIFTDYQEDLDNIVQSINFVGDSYWGQHERFKFKVNIQNFSNTMEYAQGTDRTFRSDFNIILNGYLLPDTIQRSKATEKRLLAPAQFVFTIETTSSDIETFGVSPVVNPNKTPATVIDAFNNNLYATTTNSDMNLITYINQSKELIALTGSTTPTTATFPGSFMLAPTGLPATSVLNFVFYANGQYIESGSIISFADNGNGTSTLTVNTGSLGWSFQPSWEIVSRGKFL